MINPGDYNFLCPQGATFDRTLTVTIDGTPMDLTGYTAAMQVRETYDFDTVLINLTSASGIALGGTAGTITITIADEVTAAVAYGHYAYDLELYSGGTTTRLLQGKFEVTGEITR